MNFVPLGALALSMVLAVGCASSQTEEETTVQAVSKDETGLAIRGYDPVSFFQEEGPVIGSEAISTNWRGAVVRFASAAHRERFESEPERYFPQFGAHCAFGMSIGQAVPADPTAWTVRDGKLYLNASRLVRWVWRIVPGAVGRAERHWPQMLSE